VINLCIATCTDIERKHGGKQTKIFVMLIANRHMYVLLLQREIFMVRDKDLVSMLTTVKETENLATDCDIARYLLSQYVMHFFLYDAKLHKVVSKILGDKFIFILSCDCVAIETFRSDQ
jgi:hypothetical protein